MARRWLDRRVEAGRKLHGRIRGRIQRARRRGEPSSSSNPLGVSQLRALSGTLRLDIMGDPSEEDGDYQDQLMEDFSGDDQSGDDEDAQVQSVIDYSGEDQIMADPVSGDQIMDDDSGEMQLADDGSGGDENWGSSTSRLSDNAPIDDTEPDDAYLCDLGSVEDQGCLGLELEFLVAVCRRKSGTDPHPDDTRWLSEKLANYDYGIRAMHALTPELDRLRDYTTRKMVRVLRRADLHALEDEAEEMELDTSESGFSDEPSDWPEAIEYFSCLANRDDTRSPAQVEHIATRFRDEWKQICSSEGLHIRRMNASRVHELCEKVADCLRTAPNNWSSESVDQLIIVFEQKIEEEKENQQNDYVLDLRTAEDPNHVRVNGLDPKYRAWSVTRDVSVDGNGMTPNRYIIPPNRAGEVPMDAYEWWGAEVVSPVLPDDKESTAETIRRACAALRNYFRCHKPMEVSTGLHVHLGHKHGWNLYQIKRFATIWIMVEPILIHIHRKDRGSPRMQEWCGYMGTNSKLAKYLQTTLQIERKENECVPRVTPESKARSIQTMAEHVIVASLTKEQKEFLEYAWSYPSLDDLIDALFGGFILSNGGSVEPAARIRITGNKESKPAVYYYPQTIEIRTMHGTLDANHINHWIVVLRRIIHFVRRAPVHEFQDVVGRIQREVHDGSHLWLLLQILECPPETRQFFAHPYNRALDFETIQPWFVYPDFDMVDWNEPFMAKGYGATHGEKYDNLYPYP
ncbi:hypothetical protein F4781DRAFT_388390 [Annulohypoxylon bovei var. microspora]|nr:hypothetical protein F4781DRAFT_388390 [Annulohypoxylon bovei var. microspora]